MVEEVKVAEETKVEDLEEAEPRTMAISPNANYVERWAMWCGNVTTSLIKISKVHNNLLPMDHLLLQCPFTILLQAPHNILAGGHI